MILCFKCACFIIQDIVQCDESSRFVALQENFRRKERSVICTSSHVEALELMKVRLYRFLGIATLMYKDYHIIQQLQVHSWSACHITPELKGGATLDSANLLG